jgi:hypothetical protein
MKKDTIHKIHDRFDRLEELKAVQRHYDETARSLQKAHQNLADMEKQLEEELKDIDKLEGLSIKGLFHKVLGSQEEQLEKERQEYLQLSLKHKEHIKDIELLEYELGLLQKKVSDISIIEAEIEQLKQTREQEIMSSHSHLRAGLVNIYNQMDHSRSRQAELMEAFKAGKGALASVQRVVDHLTQAKKWGDWDTMSDSRHYDRKKHSEIDRAVDQAYHTKHLLNLFSKELRDVGINSGQINIQIESIGGFMDVLFDNLITDWVVQNKIKNALRNAESTYDKVLRLVKTVENEIDVEKQTIASLEQEKDHLLIS